MLNAISPIDGRYSGKTEELQEYFSEFALIKYRIYVELQYIKALKELDLKQLKRLPISGIKKLLKNHEKFDLKEAKKIKKIEKITNHDVKAVEYYIKDQFDLLKMDKYKEFVHFCLTSQDINNTAFPLMIKDGMQNVITPALINVLKDIQDKANAYTGIPMLARTHGQPASPTTLGKELEVFIERLYIQITHLSSIPYKAKFGGATGNFNAHMVSFPEINWPVFSDQFTENYLGLERSQKTTQIAHYDNMSSLFDNLRRINVILIDLCRDMWTYISMEYFGQKVIKGEIGSSAMPHKVNPIDFENAEGNLGIANAIFDHLSNKLPVSRLQRDLTDSTVLRNVGVPFAHTLIAIKSIRKGLSKIVLQKEKLDSDLDNNWAVLAEPIQNILRREGYPKPYEALKELTRGKSMINQETLTAFIESLDIGEGLKQEMLELTPHNYIGYF